MSVIELIDTVLAVSVPNLNTKRYGDVYDILNNESINYCALVVELLRSSYNENTRFTTLRLTVVDKLREDGSNLLDIYDNTEKILNDILKQTPDTIDYEEAMSVEYIKQDFADRLAGCYAEVTFIDTKNHCQYYGY